MVKRNNKCTEKSFTSYTPYELGKQYDTTSQEAKRTHYPHLLTPPSLRTFNLPSTRPQRYLNPALWDAITLGNKTAESQLQTYMWQTESTCNPTRTFTPDSVTTYDYDYDNRLTTVNLPTNNDTVEYTYDATGRRLTKEYTYHNGANTDVTTYKYHYIGSQITEIEIDAIRNPGEGQSVLRNEEVKIHLGANSQPISYEWVKHVGENTTQATYYYHYDIHGNVLKITDSSENVKITYTYDTLGTILTETNPDSILNIFTFRGASQTIWEPETGLYYSGGYYRPDTGTALQGTGAPVLTNPTTASMIEAMAEATNANAQLAAHAVISAATAGSTGGGTPGGFSPPSGSADGMSKAGKQRPSSPAPLDPSVDFAQAYCIAPKVESEADKFGLVVSSSFWFYEDKDDHKVHPPKEEEDRKGLYDIWPDVQKARADERYVWDQCLIGWIEAVKENPGKHLVKLDPNDIANDDYADDDWMTYSQVIRDRNGKIVLAVDKNGYVYIFNTSKIDVINPVSGEYIVRKGDRIDIDGKAQFLTDKVEQTRSIKNIGDSLNGEYATYKCFNSIFQETSGCIVFSGMDIYGNVLYSETIVLGHKLNSDGTSSSFAEYNVDPYDWGLGFDQGGEYFDLSSSIFYDDLWVDVVSFIKDIKGWKGIGFLGWTHTFGYDASDVSVQVVKCIKLPKGLKYIFWED